MIAESSDIIVKQFELCTTGGASTLHPVGATEQVIGDLSRDRSAGIADHHHLAGHDLFTIDETGIVGRSFSTPATRLDLNLRAPVGQLHEPRRTGEHYALKSGEQTKGVDVDPDLVDHLHGLGVRLVGTDAPSVDLFDDAGITAHRRFLANDMAIVEGLALDGVADGRYEFIAPPLKLVGFDGSPLRAVLRSLP